MWGHGESKKKIHRNHDDYVKQNNGSDDLHIHLV